MSPTLSTDGSLPEGRPSGPSEKARGKMRAGRSMSDDMTGSLERLAASGVGRNGFVPTQEWVSSRDCLTWSLQITDCEVCATGHLLAARVRTNVRM